jgi:hypothetical protein
MHAPQGRASGSNTNGSTSGGPYWGGFAAKFPWDFGGLPAGSFEPFGDATAIDSILELHPSPGSIVDQPKRTLIGLAQDSLETAVDTLWRAAAVDLDERAIAAFVDVTGPSSESVSPWKRFCGMRRRPRPTSSSWARTAASSSGGCSWAVSRKRRCGEPRARC